MRVLRVVAVINTKGGVGKTTITRALAVAACAPPEEDKPAPKVALVDMDPQGTLGRWWERRGKPKNPHMYVNPASAEDAINWLDDHGYDWVFIDTPPAFLDELAEVLAVSHFAVVPTKPDIEGMEASRDAIVLARKAGVEFIVALNLAQERGSQVESTRAAYRGAGIEVAKKVVHNRIVHSKAADKGKVAQELDDVKATDEIAKLWEEVRARALAVKPRKVAAND